MGRPRHWQLSASSIACFKTCPFQYFLRYIKGIRKAEEPDHFRYGTNWHKIMEIIGLTPGSECGCVDKTVVYPIDFNCLICDGRGVVPDDIMVAVMRVIDDAYSRMPGTMDEEKWAVERVKLLYAASGYNWHYANQPLVPIMTEYKFDSPIYNKNGRAVPNVKIVGVIDKVAIVGGCNNVIEYKTTSSPIDSGSRYWNHLNLDTQTTLYLYIVRTLRDRGLLPDLGGEVTGLYYDVFHKPTISPKKLTIADSKKFVEDGMYFTQKFSLSQLGSDPDHKVYQLRVNEVQAIVEVAKKEGQFTIHETPEMYGARLLADIAERPEFYFVRRAIPKTDDDLNRFRDELLCTFETMRMMSKMGSWYHCEKQCEATYHCDYLDICYNGIDPDGELPDNLVRKKK